MSRLAIFVLFLGLIFSTTSCCDKGANRVDIALDGPWIIYQTHLDDGHGNKKPVLIAIAPMNATEEEQQGVAINRLHHHSPQLSTGDGFYIKESNLTTTRIFCVSFGPQCVPDGPDHLNNDSYPQSNLLQLHYSGKGSWDWASSIFQNDGMALILPMPDSFSNDGVWHIRFLGQKETDGLRSIGLQLHYLHGAANFTVNPCKVTPPTQSTPAVPPVLSDCHDDPSGQNPPQLKTLTNTGTLRIQMRAPDETDNCDRHARFGWEQTFKILGDDFGSGYKEIDPAEMVRSDGTIKWAGEDPSCALQGDMKMMPVAQRLQPTTAETFVNLGNVIDNLISTYCSDSANKAACGEKELQPLKDLRQELKTLNPFFPRISQMMRVGTLSNSSMALVTSFQTQAKATARLKFRNEEESLPDVDLILAALRHFVDDPDTKNGADCRAAVVSAQ